MQSYFVLLWIWCAICLMSSVVCENVVKNKLGFNHLQRPHKAPTSCRIKDAGACPAEKSISMIGSIFTESVDCLRRKPYHTSHSQVVLGLISSLLAFGVTMGLGLEPATGANLSTNLVKQSVVSMERVVESSLEQDVSMLKRSPGDHYQ